MEKCNMDCFNCVYPDCINDHVRVDKPYCDWSEKRKENRREYTRRKREDAKANGICIICLKNTAQRGIRCYECNIYKKRYDREKHKIRSYWRENGLCYHCGSECVPGKKLCEKHYAMQLKVVQKSNQHENIKKITEQEKQRLGKWFELNRLKKRAFVETRQYVDSHDLSYLKG